MILKNILSFLFIFLSNKIRVEAYHVSQRLSAVGLIDCMKLPARNIRVGICQKNLHGGCSILAKVPSFCQGNFQIHGNKNIFYTNKVYVVLSYMLTKKNGMNCSFKSTFAIPEIYLKKRANNKKVFNMGVIPLRQIPSKQEKCITSKRNSSLRRNSSLKRN